MNYKPDYAGSEGAHSLCTGSGKCCDGGVWGDVVPAGATQYTLVGRGACMSKKNLYPLGYREFGTWNDDAWCRVGRPAAHGASPRPRLCILHPAAG